MLSAKFLRLGMFRSIILMLLLLQNVLLVRELSLDDLGRFYLIATVGYLGNATVFVGADLYLQKRLATLSCDGLIYWDALSKYIAITVFAGALLTFISSATYFALVDQDWIFKATICSLLSVSLYLSSLGRNLIQLANHPMYSSIVTVTDILTRLILIVLVAYLWNADAEKYIVIWIVGGLVSAAVAFLMLFNFTKLSSGSFLDDPVKIINSILPIGGSGFLHWVQLQGYRPLVSVTEGGVQLVGAVSFMTTLGGAVSNAVFSIIAQFQVPEQYTSTGRTTRRYLFLVGLIGLVLALFSIPAGNIFLWVTNKNDLDGVVYLIALGVFIETCNTAIGICNNHCMLVGRSLWPFTGAAIGGCLVTYGFLFAMYHLSFSFIGIALSLLFGLLTHLLIVLYISYGNDQNKATS